MVIASLGTANEVTRLVRRESVTLPGSARVFSHEHLQVHLQFFSRLQNKVQDWTPISHGLCIALGTAANERTSGVTLGPLMGQSGTCLQ